MQLISYSSLFHVLEGWLERGQTVILVVAWQNTWPISPSRRPGEGWIEAVNCVVYVVSELVCLYSRDFDAFKFDTKWLKP